MLQCPLLYCSMLQCVALCRSVLQCASQCVAERCSVVQCGAVFVAVCVTVHATVCCSVLQAPDVMRSRTYLFAVCVAVCVAVCFAECVAMHDAV